MCEGGIPDHASLICIVVLGVKERCPPPSPTTTSWQRELILLPAAALGKACLVPLLISPAALNQLTRAQLSSPENASVTHLSYGSMRKEKCPLCQHLRQVGELTLTSYEWESCPCIPTAATLERTGPAPCLRHTIKPILFVEVWVSQLFLLLISVWRHGLWRDALYPLSLTIHNRLGS